MNRAAPSDAGAVDGLVDLLGAIERLDFALPPFVRTAWVSERARRGWEPVVERIRQSRIDVAVHSVASGLTAATIDATDDERELLERAASDHGLRVVPIEARHGSGLPPVPASRKRYLVAGRAAVDDLAGEPDATRLEMLWDQLGMPECCRQFELRIRRPLHLTDDTIARAVNTPGAHLDGRDVVLGSAGSSSPLFAVLGCRLVAHASCSFGCGPTRDLAAAWVAAGYDLGLDAEMDAVDELGQWPLEWSALHGIAEVRTPVCRVTTNAIATAATHSVRFEGRGTPDEGAAGLRFPYDQSSVRRITDSAGFARGLANQQSGAVVPAVEVLIATPRRRRPIEAAPLSATILDETLAILRDRLPITDRRIDAIHLSSYFNAVRLDDGSTGSCMSYFRFRSADTADSTAIALGGLVPADPLLLDYLAAGPRDFLRLSVLACVVAALSTPLLTDGADAEISHRFDPSVFEDATSAVVLGFGGYFDYIVRHTAIGRIHLSDLSYHRRSGRIDRRLEGYRERYPDKVITVSSGVDNRDRLAAADVVSITGSALCNGTMEDVLDAARSCRTVIVQGQSAAIFPARLFANGVSYVSTTIKPPGLIEIAETDPAEFRRLLEGGLTSRIFMKPPRLAGRGCQEG